MPSHQNRLKFFKTLKSQGAFAVRFSPTRCLFSIQYLFPLSLALSLPNLSCLTSSLCSAASAAAVAPRHQGKGRRAEMDQAEYADSTHRLPRNTSRYQGLELAFIYLHPKWLHHNPWSFWYQDFLSGSERGKALVHGWVQVTPASIPSHLNMFLNPGVAWKHIWA